MSLPSQPQDTTRTVWKFDVPFREGDVFEIPMPAGADVLTVQIQHGVPMLWATVNPDAPKEPRRFRIAGTGHPITEPLDSYIGTFQIHGGSLVFHLFEVRP